jgi:hypothetical protein
MNRLKLILAYFLTFSIICLGSFSTYSYLKHDRLFSIVYALGFILVFFPSIDYWFDVTKKLLRVKED